VLDLDSEEGKRKEAEAAMWKKAPYGKTPPLDAAPRGDGAFLDIVSTSGQGAPICSVAVLPPHSADTVFCCVSQDGRHAWAGCFTDGDNRFLCYQLDITAAGQQA
jgi:hypothetical protein